MLWGVILYSVSVWTKGVTFSGGDLCHGCCETPLVQGVDTILLQHKALSASLTLKHQLKFGQSMKVKGRVIGPMTTDRKLLVRSKPDDMVVEDAILCNISNNIR